MIYDAKCIYAKATHIPTGFSVVIGSNKPESIEHIKARVRKVLAIRLASQSVIMDNVFEYNLPDGNEYPDNLMEIRSHL